MIICSYWQSHFLDTVIFYSQSGLEWYEINKYDTCTMASQIINGYINVQDHGQSFCVPFFNWVQKVQVCQIKLTIITIKE